MHLMAKCFCTSLLFVSIVQTYAQVQQLDAVEVSATSKQIFSTGRFTYHADSVQIQHFRNQSVGELLMANSAWQVRSYGVGMLATAQTRGANAEQVRVLWKGLPIHSPTVGLIDLNLIPVFLFDDVHTAQGASSLYANGSVGGVLQLGQSSQPTGFHLSGTHSAGSFGFFQNGIKTSYNKNKLKINLAASDMRSRNDFDVPTLIGRAEPQSNAKAQVQNILFDAEYQINKKFKWEIYYWYQQADRQIPPTKVQSRRIKSEQYDQSHKVGSTLTYANNKIGQWKLNYLHFQEFQTFELNIPYILDTNLSYTHLFDLQWNKKIYQSQKTQIKTQVALQNHYMSAAGSNLNAQVALQNIQAVQASILIKNKKLGDHNLSLRQEHLQGVPVPIVYNLSGSMELPSNKNHYIKYAWARHFRLPTLNHRFWQPGGNPNLLPERGHQAEIGIENQWINKSKVHWKTEIQLSYSTTKDFILWTPNSQNIWSPQNLKAVENKSIETSQTLIYRRNKELSFKYTTLYVFNHSINTQTYSNDIQILGKQLIYQPKHILKNQSYIFYKNSSVGLYSIYNSKMYTNHINTEFAVLPAFWTWDVKISYLYKIKDIEFNIQAEINNIANQYYEMVPDRPMAGRHYRIGLQWKI